MQTNPTREEARREGMEWLWKLAQDTGDSSARRALAKRLRSRSGKCAVTPPNTTTNALRNHHTTQQEETPHD